MRFQGKFINEKGEILETTTQWFEFPTEEAFKENLRQRGWRAIECRDMDKEKAKSTSRTGSPSPHIGAIIFAVGLITLFSLGWTMIEVIILCIFLCPIGFACMVLSNPKHLTEWPESLGAGTLFFVLALGTLGSLCLILCAGMREFLPDAWHELAWLIGPFLAIYILWLVFEVAKQKKVIEELSASQRR